MALDHDTFQYTSLLQGRRIRLLFIQPCSSEHPLTPLELQLEEQSLDTADFDALSYVWGASSRKARTSCNGKNFDITQNLHEALLERRRRGIIRWLWADAICINQSHTAEKNQQVRLMSDIYGKAAQTIIWLGPYTADDERGIHLIDSMHARHQNNDPYLAWSLETAEDLNCDAWGVPNLRRELDPSWKSLFDLLAHPWFSRVWVIQEVVLSPHPLIWRGHRCINVDALIWIVSKVCTKRNVGTLRAMRHNFRSFTAQGIAHFFKHKNLAKAREISIWLNLRNSLGMQATDPRDRFFAIAGLSAHLPPTFVDYGRSLEQVSSQVGLMTMIGGHEAQTSIGLDMLADYPAKQSQSQGVRVHSWIPNFFSEQLLGVHLSQHYSTESFRKRHKAFPNTGLQLIIEEPNGESKSVTPTLPCLYHKIRELQFRAKIFDRIKVIMPLVDLIKNEKGIAVHISSTTERLQTKFLEARKLSVRVVQFINKARLLAEPEIETRDIMSGKTFDAFWRTMIYNRTHFSSAEDTEPDHSVGMAFGYWYLMLKLICAETNEEGLGLHTLQSMALSPLARPFKGKFDQIYSNRCFFVSEGGRIGWAPQSARARDSLVMVQGCRIPFTIRLASGNIWEFVGGCYVHDCMNGELWKTAKTGWDFVRFS